MSGKVRDSATRIKFALWCSRRHNWRGSPYASGGWQRESCWACESLPPSPEMLEARKADLKRMGWTVRVLPQLSDPRVRQMAHRGHFPSEKWDADGNLMSLHCHTCRQPWPCETRQALDATDETEG